MEKNYQHIVFIYLKISYRLNIKLIVIYKLYIFH